MLILEGVGNRASVVKCWYLHTGHMFWPVNGIWVVFILVFTSCTHPPTHVKQLSVSICSIVILKQYLSGITVLQLSSYWWMCRMDHDMNSLKPQIAVILNGFFLYLCIIHMCYVWFILWYNSHCLRLSYSSSPSLSFIYSWDCLSPEYACYIFGWMSSNIHSIILWCKYYIIDSGNVWTFVFLLHRVRVRYTVAVSFSGGDNRRNKGNNKITELLQRESQTS